MTRFSYSLQMLIASQIILVATLLFLLFGMLYFKLDLNAVCSSSISGALISFSFSFISCLVLRNLSKYFFIAMILSFFLTIVIYASSSFFILEYKSYFFMISLILYSSVNILIMNGINRVLLKYKDHDCIKNGKIIIGIIVAIIAFAIFSNFTTFIIVSTNIIPVIMFIIIIFGYAGAIYYYIIAHSKLKDKD